MRAGGVGADLDPVHDGHVAGHPVRVVREDRLPLVRVHEAVLVQRLESEGAHVAAKVVVVAAAPRAAAPLEQPLKRPACMRLMRAASSLGQVWACLVHRPRGAAVRRRGGR